LCADRASLATRGLDGIPVDARAIPLKDDGGVHEVAIGLGADSGLGLQSGAPRRAERVPTGKSV
jgi:hypothetical protein